MTIALIPVLAGLILCGIWVVRYENRQSMAVARVEESWSGIGVQLRRRHELTPQLVAIARRAQAHDLDLLDRVLNARSDASNALETGNASAIAQAEGALDHSLAVLLGQVLQRGGAGQNLMLLQSQLEETADQIAAAQRLHNSNVAGFNSLISGLPGRWMAPRRGLTVAPMLALPEHQRQAMQTPPIISL
ncbi:MAG: LemA family protein [Pelagimonas sp.]|jgi:LemA protein|nr:LemA family protein [Pelagimonas sp.]